MSNKDDKLSKIEQSIVNKIESTIDVFAENMSNKDMRRHGHHHKRHVKKTKRIDGIDMSTVSPEKRYELGKHKIKSNLRSHLTVFISTQAFKVFSLEPKVRLL